ncbi:hypothetical protein D3C78_1620530 [compost metagenome]
MQGLTIVAQAFRVLEQAQAAQVEVIDTGIAITPPGVADKGLEAGAVQAWHEDAAQIIFEEFTIGLLDRCALRGADAKHQQTRPLTAQGLLDTGTFLWAQG